MVICKRLIVLICVYSLLNSIFSLSLASADGIIEYSRINEDFIEYQNNPSEFSYGYMPSPFDFTHLKTITASKYLQKETLPSEFDWRNHNGVTTVKNQSSCGTCWIFGTTSVLESNILISEELTYDLSEQSVALCSDRSWAYLFDESTDPCMAGGWSYLAAETFIRKGAKLESCLPYNTSSLQCDGSCQCDSCSAVKRVNGYRLVTNDNSQTDLIKQAIYNNGPVTGAFYYSSTYLYNDSTYGYIYDAPSNNSPDHLISIVGWNDSVPHKTTPGTGAWIVKNSWSTLWGNDGYFYLAYNSSNLEEVSYLIYEDYDPGSVLYSWDETSMLGSVGYGDDDAWMAAVYSTQQTGQLSKVEFWVPSANASYNIYVYDGRFSPQLLASESGTLQEAGYYSIPISNTVILSEGQDFTIQVKIATPGYDFPIPVEQLLGNTARPEIQPNATFVRNNDLDSWSDTSNNGKNVCLRAVVDSSPVSMTLISPNGAEDFIANTWQLIQWSSANLSSGLIRIYFSSDNGSSWTPVVSGLPLTDTSYLWTVPSGLNSECCRIRVGNYNTSTEEWIVYDDSDNPFTVRTQTRFIKFTTYPAGNTYSPTGTFDVSWHVEGFTGSEGTIKIYFFNVTNEGNWYKWVEATPPGGLSIGDGTYNIDLSQFQIQDPLRCKLRIGIATPSGWLTWSDGTYSGTYIDETGYFSVLTSPHTPYIHFTSNPAGNTYSPTDTLTVTWDVEGFTGSEGTIKIYFFNATNEGNWYKWVEATPPGGLSIGDGTYNIDLSQFQIQDPLRCKLRIGIATPTGWLTWSDGTHSGTYINETGYFWVID